MKNSKILKKTTHENKLLKILTFFFYTFEHLKCPDKIIIIKQLKNSNRIIYFIAKKMILLKKNSKKMFINQLKPEKRM